jgi:chromosome-anchoring protein RacA
MNDIKTKEAAQLLGVSPTTIKRWCATFPDRFRKDASGHYVFSVEELDLLAEIRSHYEEARRMSEIGPAGLRTGELNPEHTNRPSAASEAAANGPVYPTLIARQYPADLSSNSRTAGFSTADSLASASTGNGNPLEASLETVSKRLVELEAKLSRKASDVVSFQVLEHRRELDELRRSIGELACTLESLNDVFADLQGRVVPPAAEKAAPKRKFRLSSFF